jgi:hypothetical protein
MIKLIYCYLVCLFFIILLTLNVSSLINGVINIIRFEKQYVVAYNLTSSVFPRNENFKNMDSEKIEALRKQEIEEDKKNELRREKNKLLKDSVYACLSGLILLIHILIIRRSRFH